ncbi:MAG: sigma-70 family RNA polymerase sigma factor [Pseudomonadales bacterium]|nr:sigma-70 family RNA polymerase sigma factor [Pseudomonadales bacterium]
MGEAESGITHVNASDRDEEGGIYITFLKNRLLLKRFVSRFFKRSHDIEDIVQETFVKALEAECKNKIQSPKAYLFQTAKNLSVKEVSKFSTRLQDSIEDYLPEGMLVTETTIEDQVESLQKLTLFCQALRGLPVQCRRVYILRKVYGYTQKEIAGSLGISENTVERHIAKGILRCNEHMTVFGYGREGNAKLDRKA